jgi:hypothetical protein
MARNEGDQKRKAPQSIGEIAAEMAASIQVSDARFQRFWNYKPIAKLLEPDGFFASDKKTKALIGGNKSTKTTAAVFECIMVYTGMIPPSVQGIYPHVIPKNRPRRVRIIVQDYSKHWTETIRPLLLGDPKKGAEGMLPEAWSDYDAESHMFTGPDGSYLSIIAVDPREDIDPNILRGPLLDHTMIDEINKECVYTESLTRGVSLQDGPRTVTLPFCPQEGYACWTYEGLYSACYDTATKRRLPPEKRHSDIFAQVVSMRDNPSISEAQIASTIATLKPWEVAYRVFGEYSQRASNPYFNMEMLTYWEENKMYSEGVPYRCVQKNIDLENGIFESELRKIEDDESFDEKYESIWRVWRGPIDDHKYVLTMDSAEGNTDSDNNVADLWDCTDSEKPFQAAQFRMRLIKPGDFAVECACIATIYGKCLIVPEMNNTSGGICLDRIRSYDNLYRRPSVQRFDERQTDQVGWHTDKFTKGPALETTYKKLNELFVKHKNNYSPINSRFTIMEMQAFEEKIIRNARNVSQIVWSARKGFNDDTVMVMAIAFRVICHESYKITTCKLKKKVSQYSSQIEKMALAASVRRGRAFNAMKRKPDLVTLRKRLGS